MKKTNLLLGALALSVLPFAAVPAIADDKAAVQTLYDLLSNPASESHAKAFKASVSDDWESIGDYSGKNKTADGLIGQLGGFAKLIPDLNWQVEEMIVSGNKVIVRGRGSGTPAGPFFGVDGKGKSFEIMSIDIHTLEDGKIVETHHVEDWAGAIGQLK